MTRPPSTPPSHPLAPSVSSQCQGCARDQYLWEEEIQLSRAMVALKERMRDAYKAGDTATFELLRAEFANLRDQREAYRRRRLDSLGWVNYD